MTGRADYQTRKSARNARRRERAAELRTEAAARSQRAVERLPEGGEPVKVGHHSEARHRRDLERSDADMRASVEASKRADQLDAQADASEDSAAISSDDPDALVRLRAKLAGLEARREHIKALNRDARKDGRFAAPAYVLTNLGATIRATAKRIAELEAREVMEAPADVVVGDWTAHWDRDTNRVQVFSPAPAAGEREAHSARMRAAGLVWARSEGCWQRKASVQAWAAAVALVRKSAGRTITLTVDGAQVTMPLDADGTCVLPSCSTVELPPGSRVRLVDGVATLVAGLFGE